MIFQLLLIQFTDSSVKLSKINVLIIMILIEFNATHLFSTTFKLLSSIIELYE